MKYALWYAKENGFDVFNCLNVMNNHEFLQNLKFVRGSGHLHYYMFNYTLADPGHCNPNDIATILV